MSTGPDELGDYSAEHVQILRETQYVRERPGMFFGDAGSQGLHNLLVQILDCNIPSLNSAGSTKWSLELLGCGTCRFTICGPSAFDDIQPMDFFSLFGRGNVFVSGIPLHWEIAAANAVCLDFQLTVTRKGTTWHQEFSRGYAASELSEFPNNSQDGVTLTLQADPRIFTPDSDFDYAKLAERCREQAFLRPGMRIQFIDRRPQQERREEFVAPTGSLGDYVHFLNRQRKPLHRDVIVLDGTDNEISFHVALQWTLSDECILRSYVNCYRTTHGGTHLKALQHSLAQSIRKYGREFGILRDEHMTCDQCIQGLTAVLAVELPEPLFEGPTKNRLGSPEVRPLIRKTMNQWFAAFLESEESSAIAIARHALAVHQSEEAAKEVRRQRRARRDQRRGQT